MFNKTIKKIKEKLRPELSQKQDDAKSSNSAASLESQMQNAIDMSFFYTNDKTLDALSNEEIIGKIIEKYPKLKPDNSDKEIKATFLQMLNDKDFMSSLLEYYELNIYEFFMLMLKQYGALFKGVYVKKVKQALKYKSYVIKSKKSVKRY